MSSLYAHLRCKGGGHARKKKREGGKESVWSLWNVLSQIREFYIKPCSDCVKSCVKTFLLPSVHCYREDLCPTGQNAVYLFIYIHSVDIHFYAKQITVHSRFTFVIICFDISSTTLRRASGLMPQTQVWYLHQVLQIIHHLSAIQSSSNCDILALRIIYTYI